jgi:HEAT repeat protein
MAIEDVLNKLAEGTSPSAVQVGQLSGLASGDSPAFFAPWSKLPVERRRAVLAVAVRLAEDSVELDFGTIFKACLNDPDPIVRATAIEGLWEDEEFRTADRLAELLRTDPDETVRVAAALSLSRFALLSELGTLFEPSAKRVREALYASATDPVEALEVRRRAIEALGALSDENVVSLIESTYRDPNEKMRASAIYAMGRSSDERWLPTILQEMESEEPEYRFEAARAAGQLDSPRVVVPLINLLEDEDLEVKLAAVGALGEVGGDLARKALIQCTRGQDHALRDAAKEALAQLDLDTDPLSISPFLDDSTRTI